MTCDAMQSQVEQCSPFETYVGYSYIHTGMTLYVWTYSAMFIGTYIPGEYISFHSYICMYIYVLDRHDKYDISYASVAISEIEILC
jgi:hypothetical protein